MKTPFLRKIVKCVLPRPCRCWVRARLDPELATPGDLRHCYRLLLGRKPDKEGWQAFMASIRYGAMSRRRLVRTFLESAEFRALSTAGLEPTRVDLAEFRIYLNDPESAIGRAIVHDRTYEPEVASALLHWLQPGMTFIDAGSNIGYFSLMAAKRVGERGRVLAFDPSPANCGLLRRSALENGFSNLDVQGSPLADRIARYAFFEQGGNGMLQEMDERAGPVACDAVVTTAVLDHLLPDIPRVDVVKLDVEGAEYLVLLGARALLERDHPVILTEFSPGALLQVSRIAPEQYVDYLLGFGYRPFLLDPARPPTPIEASGAAVVRQWERRKRDHVNLLFTPTQAGNGGRPAPHG